MPVFTSIGIALGATAAAAFSTGVVATAVAGGIIGMQASQAHQQSKAAKSAANAANQNQEKLLQEAKDRAATEENQASQVSARSRQRSLAQAASVAGRRGTIKTASSDLGELGGAAKTLIGE